MSRRNQILSAAAVALSAVLLLSGCRTDPTVALYVDGQQVTVDEVQSEVQQVLTQPAAASQANSLRQSATSQIVFTHLLVVLQRQALSESGTNPDQVPAANVNSRAATQNLLPLQLFSNYTALNNALVLQLAKKLDPSGTAKVSKASALDPGVAQRATAQGGQVLLRLYRASGAQLNPRYGSLGSDGLQLGGGAGVRQLTPINPQQQQQQ